MEECVWSCEVCSHGAGMMTEITREGVNTQGSQAWASQGHLAGLVRLAGPAVGWQRLQVVRHQQQQVQAQRAQRVPRQRAVPCSAHNISKIRYIFTVCMMMIPDDALQRA